MFKFICLIAIACYVSIANGNEFHGVQKYMKVGFVCNTSAADKDLFKLCHWLDGIILNCASIEKRISETSKKCESPNDKCMTTFDVHYTQYASVKPEFELDTDLVIAHQPQIDLHFNAKASISTMFQCAVEPGYQAQLWLKAPLRRYKGNVEHKLVKNGDEKARGQGLVVVDSPLTKQDGSLDCQLECRLTPLADTTTRVVYVNTQKMTVPDEVAAVNAATKRVVDILPPMSEGLAQMAIVNGVQAWAVGRCYNLNDPKTYHAMCGACLKYLSENIVARAGNARGARWQTHDCFLRYELYEIDALSKEEVDPNELH